MAAAFDPFEVLGVRPTSTPDQIRSAYREQVARYHPDKHRGNPLEELAAAKLVEINRAYAILSDDARRAEYESGRPRGARTTSSAYAPNASNASNAPASRAPIASPGMKIAQLLGWIAGLIFLLRFGLVLGREVVVLLRGVVMGFLWLLRLGPVFAIAVVLAMALAGRYVLRSRKR